MRKSSRMAPKEKQTIEIEKTDRDPLLSFNQAVTVDCSDFLGTALVNTMYSCPAARAKSVKVCASNFDGSNRTEERRVVKGWIGGFHNRRNKNSRLLLLISRDLIL